jgi:hypothetical protein
MTANLMVGVPIRNNNGRQTLHRTFPNVISEPRLHLKLGIMGVPSHIPNDANGDVLRRMIKDGDDLSRPRMMDFCYIFPERRQALAFAEIVDDRELEVRISYNKEREMWDTIVKRNMIPTHEGITTFELSLAAHAELVGGEADGWGCMTIKKGVTGA